MNEGKFLKRIRKSKGIGQTELAKKIDKTRMMIYRYENDLTPIPKETLDKILEALGINKENFEKELEKINFDLETGNYKKNEIDKRNEILESIRELDINVYLDIEAKNLIFIKNGQEILKMPLEKIEKFYQLDIFNQFLLDGYLDVKIIESFINANNYKILENESKSYYKITKDNEEYLLDKNDLNILIFETMFEFSQKIKEFYDDFPF